MIKSENGYVNVKGDYTDLMIEWVHLYSNMIEHHPELVAETCLAYESELCNADINPIFRTVVHEIVQTIKGELDNE